jgi:hypothetical protein
MSPLPAQLDARDRDFVGVSQEASRAVAAEAERSQLQEALHESERRASEARDEVQRLRGQLQVCEREGEREFVCVCV